MLLSLVSSTALSAPLLLETLRPALRNRNIKLRQQIALFLRRLVDAPTYTGTLGIKSNDDDLDEELVPTQLIHAPPSLPITWKGLRGLSVSPHLPCIRSCRLLN